MTHSSQAFSTNFTGLAFLAALQDDIANVTDADISVAEPDDMGSRTDIVIGTLTLEEQRLVAISFKLNKQAIACLKRRENPETLDAAYVYSELVKLSVRARILDFDKKFTSLTWKAGWKIVAKSKSSKFDVQELVQDSISSFLRAKFSGVLDIIE